MDYYEEFGIERDAPEDQIRQAYRRVARLLHPDHCPDDALRRQAELQMRRINGILTVLTDPRKRAEYDRQGVAGQAPPKKSPPWPWITLAAAVCIAFLAIPRGRPAAPPPVTQEEVAPSVVAPAPTLRIPRRAVVPRKVSVPPPVALLLLPEPVTTTTPLASSVMQPLEILRAEPPGPSARHTVAGEWFYVPLTRAGRTDLVPPEFIELRVTETGGIVRGRYRARYRVLRQAISPNVSFEFQGREPRHLPWHGPGGSMGEVSLQLLASGLLEVTWTAEQMGAELGFITGTATLVRKVN